MAIRIKNTHQMELRIEKTGVRRMMPKMPQELRRALVRTGHQKGTEDHPAPSHAQVESMLEEAGAPRKPELERTSPPEGQSRYRATKEAVEYRRKQILRLVLRGVPKQTIAEHLGVPIRVIYDDLLVINQDMRTELQSLDYVGYIGMSMAFFDECRTIALRAATDTAEKSTNIKMGALRTAMMAETSKQEFLTRVGLFKVVSPTDPFNQIQSGRHGSYSDENDVQKFLQLIAQSASGQVVDVESTDVRP